jgi:hypothetical protein
LSFLLSSHSATKEFAFAFATVFALPSGLSVGLQPPRKSRAARRIPLCRRLERSPKGEVTYSLPLFLGFALALPFGRCFAFFVAIPEGDLLLFLILATIFCVFSPKIACQVPKPPNSLNQKEIELAF